MSGQSTARTYLSRLNSGGTKLIADSLKRRLLLLRGQKANARIRVLDVGCGASPYWEAVQNELDNTEIVLVDCETSHRDAASKFGTFVSARFPISHGHPPELNGPFDLILFAGVYHELRQQLLLRRFSDDGYTRPWTASDIIKWIGETILQSNLLSKDGILMVGDVSHQPYWSAEELDSARKWQINDLPRLLNHAHETGHADPAYSFFKPSEVICGSLQQFDLLEHEECFSVQRQDIESWFAPAPPLEGDHLRQIFATRQFFLISLQPKSIPSALSGSNFDQSALVLKGEAFEDIITPIRNLDSELSKNGLDLNARFQTIRDSVVFDGSANKLKASLFKSLCELSVNSLSTDSKDTLLPKPSYLCFAPSLYSSYFKELERPSRLLINGVVGVDTVSGCIISKDAELFLDDEWVSKCYSVLFNRESLISGVSDTDLKNAIRIPSLFKHLTSGSPSKKVKTLTLFISPVHSELNESETEEEELTLIEYSERLRQHALTKAFNISDCAGKHVAVALAPFQRKCDLFTNAEAVNGYFREELVGTSCEPSALISRSILALYLDFLFACAFANKKSNAKAQLNAVADSWLNGEDGSKVRYVTRVDEIDTSFSGCAWLPSSARDLIAGLVRSLNEWLDQQFSEPGTSVSLPSVWHLIPGSNYIDENEVTGNLMIFTDVPLFGTACDRIRAIHDHALNAFQRLDDKLVLKHRYNLSRHNALRAARASILARNFSHVTGSHVISNPDFGMELAGEGVWEIWRKFLASQEQTFSNARNYWLDNSRNEPGATQCWTEGLQTLRSMLAVTEQSGGALLEQTRRFHQYLQGRFDFIARAIDETHDRQEPVFLISDLLDGFLRQSAYLGTLVADLGVRLPKIEFVLHLKDKKFRAKWRKAKLDTPSPSNVQEGWQPGIWEHFWCDEEGESAVAKYEELLGLPGGMIACHAFYALLENIIRNSVKYGSDRGAVVNKSEVKPYELHLKLSDDNDGRFCLRLWDNCSGIDPAANGGGARAAAQETNDKEKSPYDSIKEQIRQDILDEKGRQRVQGLGVQEMIICADSLLSEKARNALVGRNKGKQSHEHEKALRLVTRSESEGDNKDRLTFEITLSKPVFVGIWVKANESEPCVGMVRRTHNLNRIVDNFKGNQSSGFSAQILIIDGELDITEVITTVAAHHGMLPYRLFIVCRPEKLEMWQRAIKEAEPHHADYKLPPGRLRVLADSVLREWLAEIALGSATENDEQKQHLSIACFDAWLRAWKGKRQGDKPWDLWLGFELAESRVKETWEPLLEEFQRYRSTDVFKNYQSVPKTIRVFARQGQRGASPGPVVGPNQPSKIQDYWQEELSPNNRRRHALVFDNHGVSFPELLDAEKATDPREGPRFYQKFGSETPDLYRLISNPPTNSFGFAYFVYSLVESCLANVAVLDERIAGDMLFAQGRDSVVANPGEFERKLGAHQKSGLYPLFTFKPLPTVPFPIDCTDPLVGMFSPMHHVALKKLLPYQKRKTEGIPCIPDLRQEGIQFRIEGDYESLKKSGVTCIREEPQREKACTRADSLMANASGGYDLVRLMASCELDEDPQDGTIDLDALIVHEGALDLMAKHPDVNWNEEMSNKLWKIAPWVVRTSGRGRATKHLKPWLPFIEFNEVSSAMLTSRNKYSLVRGLFGASGADSDKQDPKSE